MKDFGLVVIGAHFGVWLEDEISKYNNHNILLVEPVPYNIKILEQKYSSNQNIHICKTYIFSLNCKGHPLLNMQIIMKIQRVSPLQNIRSFVQI